MRHASVTNPIGEPSRALIGHTGFVGSTLDGQCDFTRRFHRANISQLGDESYDLVVCAAAPGSMYEANNSPERDRAQIEQLIDDLRRLRTDQLILISSIAVLADFAHGDTEDTGAFQTELAYGRHRRMLEAFVEEQFENSLIVRLPALFGPGLRKNLIFDLLNPVPTMLSAPRMRSLLADLPPDLSSRAEQLYALDESVDMFRLDRARLNRDSIRPAMDRAVEGTDHSATQFHHPDSTHQFYDVTRLWSDVTVALDADLTRIHLVTEPIRVGDIHRRLLGSSMPSSNAASRHEDMRTDHAALWGSTGPYQTNAEKVINGLARFFERERSVS